MKANETISRRNFLKGTSLAAMGVMAGAALEGCAPSAKDATTATDLSATGEVNSAWAIEELDEPAEVLECDLCIIGGGGTGLAAAIQAIDLGMKPIVIEKKSVTGGTFIGSEGLFAVGSHWQKDAGETLTLDNAVMNCLDYHHWIPNPDLYHNFFKRTAETVEWLEGHGVEFDHVQSLGDSSVSWHVYAGNHEEGTGVTFMKSFGAEAERLGVQIELSCSGKKLIVEDGVVKGALCKRDDGTVVQVNAKAVVVGTGGYSNNHELIRDLNGSDPDRITSSGLDGRDGDGIKMMRAAGGDLAASPGCMMFYGPIMPGSTYGTQFQSATSLQPHLWVNQDGIRFTREDMFLKNFAYAGNAIYNQRRAFTVCNQAMFDRYEKEGGFVSVGVYVHAGDPMDEIKKELQTNLDRGNEYIYQGSTVSELANAMGIDASALEDTVKKYNADCAAGNDTQFGKPAEYMIAMEEGPWYAFEVFNGYFTTVGGIRISPNAEVCDENGEPIKGLYAGGSDAGGLYGDTYDVAFAPGSQASWAINSGRMSAKYAAAYMGMDVDPTV